MQGTGDRRHLPGDRHPRRRRPAQRGVRADRGRSAPDGAGRVRRRCASTRVDIGVAPGTDVATVSAALSLAARDPAVRPVDATGPRRHRCALDGRLPGHDRADRGDRPVRRRVPDLQHAVDDRRRAGPRRRAAARGRRHPPPGDALHAQPGAGPRRVRVAARGRPRRPARRGHGRLRPDDRIGHARSARRSRPTRRSSRCSSGSG